ncbi:MAG: plasmid partitioning protein RepB [Pseudomonadota bacterium]
MARKDKLSQVFSTESPGEESPRLPAGNFAKGKPPPFGLNRYAAEHLKRPNAKSVQEIDTSTIAAGGPTDRMDEADEAADTALLESIKRTGQTTPVLLRPDPDTPGHFRIIYGRRRVRALRALGMPVKAIIRDDISDADAVVIQGQENSVRKDLSFLERSRFLVAIEREGFPRAVAIDALAIDKARASNYAKLGKTLPDQIAQLIGPAPGIGRNRWLDFVTAYETLPEAEKRIEAALLKVDPVSMDSDGRFALAFAALQQKTIPQQSKAETRKITSKLGTTETVYATIKSASGSLSVNIPGRAKTQRDFAAYLDQRIEDLIREELDRWQQTSGQEAKPTGKETH